MCGGQVRPGKAVAGRGIVAAVGRGAGRLGRDRGRNQGGWPAKCLHRTRGRPSRAPTPLPSSSLSLEILSNTGWQKLGERRLDISRKVRIFSERKGHQDEPFCCETDYCHNLRSIWKAFVELSTKATIVLESFSPKSACFQESTCGERSTKVSLLSESIQWKSVCFWRSFNESQPAFRELSEKFGELLTKINLLSYVNLQ